MSVTQGASFYSCAKLIQFDCFININTISDSFYMKTLLYVACLFSPIYSFSSGKSKSVTDMPYTNHIHVHFITMKINKKIPEK